MSNREFTATRTMLANGMATAGAELLLYMGVGAALAAIPNTEPPQYVVAGTLKMISKMLPGVESTAPAVSPAPAAAGIEGLTRYDYVPGEAGRMIIGQDDNGSYVLRADVERLLGAHAGVVTAEPTAWESPIYKSDDAKRVMMSAFAFCPSDLSHPQKMAWIGDFFTKHFAAPAAQAPAEVDIDSPYFLSLLLDYVRAFNNKGNPELAYKAIIDHIKSAKVAAQAPVQNAEEVPSVVREAIEAAFEERDGWRVKIAAAVRSLATKEAAAAEAPSQQGGDA